MFKAWGSWVQSRADADGEARGDAAAAVRTEAGSAHGDAAVWSRTLGGYLYDVASKTTEKISESVAETAQTLKKYLDQKKIDNIIDKTILGDFQKEQKRFVEEKKSRKTNAAVLPWVGTSDEETIQQQILSLSADRRNFLQDPPAGTLFYFDLEQMYPMALVMLQEDQLLSMMRFDLVPKHVKEDVFWRNYFYRISLIKQSAQLSELAAQQEATRKKEAGRKDTGAGCFLLTENTGPRSSPMNIHSSLKTRGEESISSSPSLSEFASDAIDIGSISKEDLLKDMEQLVLDKKETVAHLRKETTAWEKELQEELEKYEFITDFDSRDDSWDKEIEDMLKAD